MSKLDQLLTIEKENKLFEREYCGVPYWEMLRFYVYGEILYGSTSIGDKIHREESIVKKILKYFRALLLSIKNIWFFTKKSACDVLWLNESTNNDEPRFKDYWEKPENVKFVYLDNTIDPTQINILSNNCNVMPIYVATQFEYYIRKLFHKLPEDKNENKFLEHIDKTYKSLFDRTLSATEMKKRVQYYNIINKHSERFFGKLLKRFEPKAIVVICYYMDHVYSAYKYAKEKDIKIIEFQHGLIFDHVEYNFEDLRGVNNYTPDYFLVFGEAQTNGTRLLPTTKTVAVGFPYQEYKTSEYKNISMKDKGIVIYPLVDTLYETEIDKFINLASQKGYEVFIKYHPARSKEYKKYYPILSKNPNAKMITNENSSIYYWLKAYKFHVVADSTVGYEATTICGDVVFVPSFVDYHHLRPLLDEGLATLFSSAEDLLDKLNSQNYLESYSGRYYRRNSKDNVSAFFSELKKNNFN